MRTRELASREYEGFWSDIASQIEVQIAAGETDAVRIIERAWNWWSAGLRDPSALRLYYEHLGVPNAPDGTPTQRLTVRDGAYRLIPFATPRDDWFVRMLADHVSAQAEPYDCVVELGSGFGRNLIRLHAALPAELQPDFHACELTETGRSVTERLHGLVDGMHLQVHPFDYYEPDLGFLKGEERVLFFTYHSIEQIPNLGRQVLDEAFLRSRSCAGLHFEPVGWQADASLRSRRASRSELRSDIGRWAAKRRRRMARRVDRALGTPPRGHIPGIVLSRSDLGSSKRASRNAAAWSRERDYNTDLLPVLRELEIAGRLALGRVDLNLVGENPFNPTTVIGWRSVA